MLRVCGTTAAFPLPLVWTCFVCQAAATAAWVLLKGRPPGFVAAATGRCVVGVSRGLSCSGGVKSTGGGGECCSASLRTSILRVVLYLNYCLLSWRRQSSPAVLHHSSTDNLLGHVCCVAQGPQKPSFLCLEAPTVITQLMIPACGRERCPGWHSDSWQRWPGACVVPQHRALCVDVFELPSSKGCDFGGQAAANSVFMSPSPCIQHHTYGWIYTQPASYPASTGINPASTGIRHQRSLLYVSGKAWSVLLHPSPLPGPTTTAYSH